MYRDNRKMGLDVNRPIHPATGEISPTVSDSRLPAHRAAFLAEEVLGRDEGVGDERERHDHHEGGVVDHLR